MQPIGQDTTAKRRPSAFRGTSHEVASLPGLEPGTYCLEGRLGISRSGAPICAYLNPKYRAEVNEAVGILASPPLHMA
jgi:hypothetical protein